LSETQIARRELILAASSAMAMPAFSYSRILGANDRIQVGIIGCGLRGQFVMTSFQKVPSVTVSALCDVWGVRVDEARQKAPGARCFQAHEQVLEMKDLAAVYIATPDHWHARIAIEAMQAGKDVYVEKPLGLTIEEGSEVVRTARVNGRICQVGTQRLSAPSFLHAKKEYFDTGKIGKLLLMRCWWLKNPVHILRAPDALKTKPANLDWTRYLGQAKWREWDPQQYWNFRAYLDFGGGQITDLFSHWADVLHMLTGEHAPVAAVASGGIYYYKDGRTAPDTIHAALEYAAGFTASFDGLVAAHEKGSGGEFVGTNGRLFTNGQRFEFYSSEPGVPPIVKTWEEDQVLEHVTNFIDCMPSRKLPNDDVLLGHRAAQAAHLANIAYTKGKRIVFDPAREQIVS
jgi:predicted dehydrogenase